MSSRANVFAACVAFVLAYGPAAGQAASSGDLTQPPLAKSKSVKAKRAAAKEAKAKPATEAPAPCARGQWKDDPVCFGEDDQNVLPTPAAGSAERSGAAKNEVGVKPMVNINSRTSAPGVIYQSNGNTVTSDFGGGVSLHLPF